MKATTLKIACVILGLLHAVLMCAFAVGPELSPLVVHLVDVPIAYFTAGWEPRWLALGLPIVVCSVLYPGILYFGIRFISRRFAKSRPASSCA